MADDDNGPRTYGVFAAARFLGKSATFIRDLREDGILPARKEWTKEELEAARGKVPPRAGNGKATRPSVTKRRGPLTRTDAGERTPTKAAKPTRTPADASERAETSTETPAKARPRAETRADDPIETLNLPKKPAGGAPAGPPSSSTPPGPLSGPPAASPSTPPPAPSGGLFGGW